MPGTSGRPGPTPTPGAESDDWTLAVEAIYCGESSDEELLRRARGAELAPAEAWHVDRVVKTDRLLRQMGAMRRLPPRTIPLPEASRLARDRFRGLAYAAEGTQPLPLAIAMYALGPIPLSATATLTRHLSHDFMLCVEVESDVAEVDRILCGADAMHPLKMPGTFGLSFDPKAPKELLLQRVYDQLSIDFRDGTRTCICFY